MRSITGPNTGKSVTLAYSLTRGALVASRVGGESCGWRHCVSSVGGELVSCIVFDTPITLTDHGEHRSSRVTVAHA